MNVFCHPVKAFWELYFRSEHFKRLVETDLRKAIESRIYHKRGIHYDLDSPKTLNEKILWLMLNTDTSLWSEYADKYKVRSHIEDMGLGEYLPRLYGTWKRFEDIDFEILPERFVLKCNHDNESVQFIDKNTLDIPYIRKKLNRCVGRKFGYYSCEPHYSRIEPLIMAEEWLDNSHEDISTSIIDYKIWCFNGEPHYIMTIHNRDRYCMYINLYDDEWDTQNQLLVYSNHYKNGRGIVPKPDSLTEMLRISRMLSKEFPQVRIDFYDVDGKPYIGEMTFTSGGGIMSYFSEEGQLILGNLITLPLV